MHFYKSFRLWYFFCSKCFIGSSHHYINNIIETTNQRHMFKYVWDVMQPKCLCRWVLACIIGKVEGKKQFFCGPTCSVLHLVPHNQQFLLQSKKLRTQKIMKKVINKTKKYPRFVKTVILPRAVLILIMYIKGKSK